MEGESSLFFSFYMLIILMIVSKSTSLPNRLATSCLTYPKFANNSQYEANLKTLFRYLTNNATNPTGFYQAVSSNGNSTNNPSYGHFLCRGDLNASSCKDCVIYATTKLPRLCPNRKFALIWYDKCMVKYDYKPFFGYMYITWVVNSSSNYITGNATRFMENMNNMMNKIATRAAMGDSNKKFAVDYVNNTEFQTIYGLGQCTPDLSPSDCNTCLVDATKKFIVSQGGTVVHFSCIARYEVNPFFNLSLLPLHSSPSPRQPPSPVAIFTHSSVKRKVSAMVIVIAIAIPMVVAAIIGLGIFFRKKRAKKYNAVPVGCGEDFTTLQSLQYDLATLQSATNNFADENKLGEGGFGGVYKGTLANGQEIAVKRLSKSSSQGVQEFKNEVLLVAKLQHKNLVRLLGFCLAEKEKLLVYEYVPNKSLDNLLFDPQKQGHLNWMIRYKIIVGIARGMLYLHHDSRLRIIHRDLKASNILLDEDMNAKVSDFGLARIVGGDQSQDNTERVAGTYGYMAPEYVHGQFSIKSDVYSFGVLILEIISGKRNTTFHRTGYAKDLLSYAWKKWRDGNPMEFVDPTIIRDSCSTHEVLKCIHLALLCVQEAMHDRPTMETAVLMMDTNSVSLPAPQEPAFYIQTTGDANFAKDSIRCDQSWSQNDVTVTEFEPR